MQAYIFVWSDILAILGKGINVDAHHHAALQMTISLHKSFSLTLEGEQYHYHSIIIAPNAKHQFHDNDHWHLNLLFNPESEMIQKLLSNSSNLPQRDRRTLRSSLEKGQVPDCFTMQSLKQDILATYSDSLDTSFERDSRIEQALQIIKNSDEYKISSEELSAQLYLSPSRFLHLFTEEVGIPLRRYLLWHRLLAALRYIAIEDKDFTTAAHESGFADSAHLSRTFRQMFGLSLSNLFKHSQFIQVYDCQKF